MRRSTLQRLERLINDAQNTNLPFYAASDYGAVADGTDHTDELQDAFDAVTASGGALFLPKGGVRADGQLSLDGSNVTIVGNGAYLDLRYEGDNKLIIGNGSTIRENVFLHDVNFVGPGTASDSKYLVEARYLSGLYFSGNMKMLAFHGFLKLGRAGDTGGVGAIFINGNINASHSLANCGHFIDCKRLDGTLAISGTGSVEGDNPFASGTAFLNFDTTATRPDGVHINGAWTIRRFDAAINLRAGIANGVFNNIIFDGCLTAAVYADTSVDSINGLQIQNCHIGNYTLNSASAYGIYIARSTHACQQVLIQNNKIFACGANGIRIDGTPQVNISHNDIANVGQHQNNTYDAILINGDATGVMAGNTVYSDAANKHRHGTNNGSASANFKAWGTTSVGHGTAATTGTHEF